MGQAGGRPRARGRGSRQRTAADRGTAVQSGTAGLGRPRAHRLRRLPACHAGRAHLRRADRPRHDAQRQWSPRCRRAPDRHGASPGSRRWRSPRPADRAAPSLGPQSPGLSGGPRLWRVSRMIPAWSGPSLRGTRRTVPTPPGDCSLPGRLRCGLRTERHPWPRGPESARRVGLPGPGRRGGHRLRQHRERPVHVAVTLQRRSGTRRDRGDGRGHARRAHRIGLPTEPPPRLYKADFRIVERESTGGPPLGAATTDTRSSSSQTRDIASP